MNSIVYIASAIMALAFARLTVLWVVPLIHVSHVARRTRASRQAAEEAIRNGMRPDWPRTEEDVLYWSKNTKNAGRDLAAPQFEGFGPFEEVAP